jgi:fatty acid desaturase
MDIETVFYFGLLLIFLYFMFGRFQGGMTVKFERNTDSKYFALINRACFYVCMLSIAFGFVLTLLMIWEVFAQDQRRVVEKSWLTIAVFFGTGVLVSMINNVFSLRVVTRDDDTGASSSP